MGLCTILEQTSPITLTRLCKYLKILNFLVSAYTTKLKMQNIHQIPPTMGLLNVKQTIKTQLAQFWLYNAVLLYTVCNMQ